MDLNLKKLSQLIIGKFFLNFLKKKKTICNIFLRALELKPRYARGWLNLGVSHSNLSNFPEAARCYLKALDLNPNAIHIWSYLRVAFTCLQRYDLVALTESKDLQLFRKEFNF